MDFDDLDDAEQERDWKIDDYIEDNSDCIMHENSLLPSDKNNITSKVAGDELCNSAADGYCDMRCKTTVGKLMGVSPDESSHRSSQSSRSHASSRSSSPSSCRSGAEQSRALDFAMERGWNREDKSRHFVSCTVEEESSSQVVDHELSLERILARLDEEEHHDISASTCEELPIVSRDNLLRCKPELGAEKSPVKCDEKEGAIVAVPSLEEMLRRIDEDEANLVEEPASSSGQPHTTISLQNPVEVEPVWCEVHTNSLLRQNRVPHHQRVQERLAQLAEERAVRVNTSHREAMLNQHGSSVLGGKRVPMSSVRTPIKFNPGSSSRHTSNG